MTEDYKWSEGNPDFMNPANVRKTPYTDEEIETFVEGFILGLDDHEWHEMKIKYEEENARNIIRAGIVKRDERNLVNITPDGLKH